MSIQNPIDPIYFDTLIREFKSKKSMPDFFSYYLYHITSVVEYDDVQAKKEVMAFFRKDEIKERLTEIKEHSEKLHSLRELGKKHEFNESSFYITEWNFDFSCRNFIHDTLFKAPFIIKNAIESIHNIGVLAYWLGSDISAEYSDSDAPLFGGPGLISRNSIRKPAFFAYQFLSNLGTRLLSKGEGYIITSKSEDNFSVILFNYKYIDNNLRLLDYYWNITGNLNEYLDDTEKCSFSVEIQNINSGKYRIRQHILNSSYGSVYDTWMGLSAIRNLQPHETEWLERTCFPNLLINFLTAKGSLNIHCELEPNEVRLLEINRILE